MLESSTLNVSYLPKHAAKKSITKEVSEKLKKINSISEFQKLLIICDETYNINVVIWAVKHRKAGIIQKVIDILLKFIEELGPIHQNILLRTQLYHAFSEAVSERQLDLVVKFIDCAKRLSRKLNRNIIGKMLSSGDFSVFQEAIANGNILMFKLLVRELYKLRSDGALVEEMINTHNSCILAAAQNLKTLNYVISFVFKVGGDT